MLKPKFLRAFLLVVMLSLVYLPQSNAGFWRKLEVLYKLFIVHGRTNPALLDLTTGDLIAEIEVGEQIDYHYERASYTDPRLKDVTSFLGRLLGLHHLDLSWIAQDSE